MKVLVTGAAGFIGFHLSQHFLNLGCEVVGIDNLLSGQERNLAQLKQARGFQFFKRDIVELDASTIAEDAVLSRALSGVARIYHMACPASPPIYQKDPLHTMDTCYLGSRNIFEIAKQQKARMLIASTSEIYGDPEMHPQPESYRGNVNTMGPRACYDEGKRIMETLGYVYSLSGVEVRTARIFNTYGPRMSPADGRVLTNFIGQALRGEDLTIYGTGKQTRSFCFYSDLLRGLNLLMESDVTKAVNLGSQFEFTILELAEKVISIVNPKLKICFRDLPVDDPKQRRPEATTAKTELGWEPQIDLMTGIKAMVEDFRSEAKV